MQNPTELTNLSVLTTIKDLEVQDATFFGYPYLVMDKAQGSYIYDIEGNKYIDMCAGFGSLALGHNHPIYNDLFKQYLDTSSPTPLIQGLGDVFSSIDKYNLLKKLSSLFPRFKFSFALSGAQAVTISLKTAILYTKNTGIIAFKGAYHGLDFGALSVTERSFFKKDFPNWYGNTYFCDYNTSDLEVQINEAISYFKKNNQKPAAIIVEPVQGRAGVKIPDKAWMQELRTLADKYKLCLIYDEIFTGLGRTGSISYHYEVPCDILCLGKALGGGLPISVCCAKQEIMDAWPKSSGEAIHTGTFFGHPLSARFACRFLDYFEKNRLDLQSKNMGDYFVNKLKSSLNDSPYIKDIRVKGLMVAIEFINPELSLGAKVSDLLREERVITIPEGEKAEVISFTPALNIDKSIVDETVLRVTKVIKNFKL